MSDSLQPLFDAIGCAQNAAEWRAALLERGAAFFGATRSGLFWLDDRALWPSQIESSPIFRALLERHAPVHQTLIGAPHRWDAMQSRADHGHVLVGPILRHSQLSGVLAFTRHRDLLAFDEACLAAMSAVCLHASTRLAHFERASKGAEESELPELKLTAREKQIAALVAQGHSNHQIAAQLCVSSETVKAALKRIFRKTGVSTRAQLAARLPLDWRG